MTAERTLKRNALLVVTLIALGCDPVSPAGVDVNSDCRVDQSSRPEAHRCLVECTKAGNPMSDEEGEDLVSQCESSCSEVYCVRRYWYWLDDHERDCRHGMPQPYFDACVQAGWKP